MMLEHLLIGAGFAFAAAVQPGPLQAFYLARVAASGWRKTLPAALAPVISDGPIAVFVLLVLKQVHGGLEQGLKVAGAALLFAFAVAAFRSWRSADTAQAAASGSAPRNLLHAVAVNFVNPGPWLGWSFVLGPVFLTAWAQQPAAAVGLVVAFYVTMVVTLAAFIVLLGTTTVLGPQARRHLLLVSALALAALAVYQLASL